MSQHPHRRSPCPVLPWSLTNAHPCSGCGGSSEATYMVCCTHWAILSRSSRHCLSAAPTRRVCEGGSGLGGERVGDVRPCTDFHCRPHRHTAHGLLGMSWASCRTCGSDLFAGSLQDSGLLFLFFSFHLPPCVSFFQRSSHRHAFKWSAALLGCIPRLSRRPVPQVTPAPVARPPLSLTVSL